MNSDITTDPIVESEEHCPCCPRHCPLSAPNCERGRNYASMTPEERAQRAPRGEDSHGGPDREHGGHGGYGRHGGPHGHGPRPGEGESGGPWGGSDRGEGRGWHHGPHGDFDPEDDDRPRHGPHGDFGPEDDDRPRHGPHGRPGFPEDPDSLSGLMHRCTHALHHRADRNRGQRSVLAMLYAWGEVDQRTLQEQMGIRPGSISELLAKLEAKGYITRDRSEADRRIAVVTLTEEGREAARVIPDGTKDLFAALTEEEQEQLKSLLKKLLESWE